MELKTLTNKYQEAFNNKDINKLKSLFDKDIILKDWERSVKGLNNVLTENQKIFDSVKSLIAETVNEFHFENTAICVLKIHINNEDVIDVVDIIEFNEKGKIISITAYKG